MCDGARMWSSAPQRGEFGKPNSPNNNSPPGKRLKQTGASPRLFQFKEFTKGELLIDDCLMQGNNRTRTNLTVDIGQPFTLAVHGQQVHDWNAEMLFVLL